MRRQPRRYVRQMPKIYGNVQPVRRSYAGLVPILKGALATFFSIGIIYFVFYGPLFQIRHVEVQGVVLTNPDHFARLVPMDKTIWTFSKSEVIKNVLQEPLVVGAEVFRGIPHTVRIVIEEKQPALAWYTGDTVALLDANGYDFTNFTTATLPAPETPAGQKIANIPHVYDAKNLPVTLDQLTVRASFVSFMTAAQQQLQQYLPGIEWTRVEIADSTYDVTFIAKQGLRVQMNSLADAGVQVRNLTRLIHQKKVTLTNQVDLRIDRWAYVR